MIFKNFGSALMFLAAVFFFQRPAFSATAEPVDHIMAIVNSEIITASDFTAFAKKADNGGMIDDLLLFGKPASSLKGNKTAELDYLINEKILDSEVKRLNLSVTIERVEQEIRDIAKRNNVSRADMMSAVKAQGMSPSEYQDFIKTRIERQSLIEQEVSAKIRVSDEDVQAQYLRDHPNASTGSYEYTLAHIYFNPRKGGVEQARERANAVEARLHSGESFEALAEQNSEDPNFTAGGLLGTFEADDLNKDMLEGLKGLSAGEVSSVVETKDGFHILKILNKKVISDPNFEKEKEKIRAKIFEQAFQKQLQNWLEAQKEDSFIRINK
jgi:peptidyl-prolyl cis-trans isomerase SurA